MKWAKLTLLHCWWECKLVQPHREEYVCVLTQLCPTLCDPMDYSSPGSFGHRIIQVRILEWLPFPPPGDLPDPGIELIPRASLALAHGFFTTVPLGKSMEKSLDFPLKTKNRATIWSFNPTIGHISGKYHNSKRHMHSNIHEVKWKSLKSCLTLCDPMD